MDDDVEIFQDDLFDFLGQDNKQEKKKVDNLDDLLNEVNNLDQKKAAPLKKQDIYKRPQTSKETKNNDFDDFDDLLEDNSNNTKVQFQVQKKKDDLFDDLLDENDDEEDQLGGYAASFATRGQKNQRPQTANLGANDELKKKREQLFGGVPGKQVSDLQQQKDSQQKQQQFVQKNVVNTPKSQGDQNINFGVQSQNSQARLPDDETTLLNKQEEQQSQQFLQAPANNNFNNQNQIQIQNQNQKPANNQNNSNEIPTINIAASRRQSAIRPPLANQVKEEGNLTLNKRKSAINTFSGQNTAQNQNSGNNQPTNIFNEVEKNKSNASQNLSASGASQNKIPRLMKTHEETLKDTPLNRSFQSGDHDDDLLADNSQKNDRFNQQKGSGQKGGFQNLNQSVQSIDFQEQQQQNYNSNKEVKVKNTMDLMQTQQRGQITSQLDAEFVKKQQDLQFEEYQNQLKLIKKSMEQQQKLQEENYQKQLEYERKTREQMLIESQNLFQMEKSRLKEVHEMELKQKDQLHKNELDLFKRQLENETQSLKKQLEQQFRMNHLNEEMKLNMEKINVIAQKVDQTANANIYSKQGQNQYSQEENNENYDQKKKFLEQREKNLEEQVRNLNFEKETLKKEKEKLEKWKLEFQEREKDFRIEVQSERDQLKQEYARVSEFQEQIKNQEIGKQKEFSQKEFKLERIKMDLEEEKIRLNEEFQARYREFELQAVVFETLKKEFEEQMSQQQNNLKEKIKENENLRIKMAQHEFELTKKQKAFEIKEFELVQMQQNSFNQQKLLQIEKLELENHQGVVQNLVKNHQNSNFQWKDYQMDIVNQREKLATKEQELLQKEKLLKNLQQQIAAEQKFSASNNNFHKQLKNTTTTIKNQFDHPTNKTKSEFQKFDFSRQTQQITKFPQSEDFSKFLNTLDFKNPHKINETNNFQNSQQQIQQPTYFNPVSSQKQYEDFNINSYLEKINQIDQISGQNNEYIQKEKENIIKQQNQIDNSFYLHKNHNNSQFSNSSPFMQKPSLSSDYN